MSFTGWQNRLTGKKIKMIWWEWYYIQVTLVLVHLINWECHSSMGEASTFSTPEFCLGILSEPCQRLGMASHLGQQRLPPVMNVGVQQKRVGKTYKMNKQKYNNKNGIIFGYSWDKDGMADVGKKHICMGWIWIWTKSTTKVNKVWQTLWILNILGCVWEGVKTSNWTTFRQHPNKIQLWILKNIYFLAQICL